MKKWVLEKRLDLLFLIVISASLRIPWLDAPPLSDELYASFDFLTALPLFSPHGADGVLGDWPAQWRRQLAIHPPGFYSFYFVWIRIFGDSFLSLRIPTFILGLTSIFLSYRIGEKLYGRSVGFWSGMLLGVSAAHIHFSVSAVSAIFELTSLLYAVYAFLIFLQKKGLESRLQLYVSLFLGVSISYFFAVFLFLLMVVLVFLRGKVARPWPLIAIAAVFLLLVCLNMVDSELRGIYETFHWRVITGQKLVQWFQQLPYWILRYGY